MEFVERDENLEQTNSEQNKFRLQKNRVWNNMYYTNKTVEVYYTTQTMAIQTMMAILLLSISFLFGFWL